MTYLIVLQIYYYNNNCIIGHGEIRTHDFLSNRFQDDRIKPTLPHVLINIKDILIKKRLSYKGIEPLPIEDQLFYR